MIASLLESLARGTNLLGGKPIYSKVGMLQFMVEESELKVPPTGICPSTLMVSPIKATSSKAERELRMTMEVRELLSQLVLDTSGHVSENSTPKRLNSMVVLTPLPHKLGDLSSPVDTSSQVSALDDAEMGEASLGRSLLPPHPQLRHQHPVVHPSHRCRLSEKRPTRNC